MTDDIHLSEEERQSLGEGSLPAERVREVQDHLSACPACARDVARLQSIIRKTRESEMSFTDLDQLWPGIRARIERSKVVPITGAPADRLTLGRRMMSLGTVVAAALVLAALFTWHARQSDQTIVATEPDSPTRFTNVSDSTRAYEEEATVLLNRLELQRSMLRPEAAAAIDHDLAVIDSAIAELRVAIAHDPNNPALKRLLASSLRQKVEVLARVGNAG